MVLLEATSRKDSVWFSLDLNIAISGMLEEKMGEQVVVLYKTPYHGGSYAGMYQDSPYNRKVLAMCLEKDTQKAFGFKVWLATQYLGPHAEPEEIGEWKYGLYWFPKSHVQLEDKKLTVPVWLVKAKLPDWCAKINMPYEEAGQAKTLKRAIDEVKG
jgi:hypothetical protein